MTRFKNRFIKKCLKLSEDNSFLKSLEGIPNSGVPFSKLSQCYNQCLKCKILSVNLQVMVIGKFFHFYFPQKVRMHKNSVPGE